MANREECAGDAETLFRLVEEEGVSAVVVAEALILSVFLRA